MKGAEPVVRRSVLDRLIETAEPEPRPGAESVRALRAAVLRDVEWLLNTRRIAQPAPPHLTELSRSVYHFGLPDITSTSADATQRHELLLELQECIEWFEPRLTAVRVSEVESSSGGRRDLRFRVEALLRIGEDAEPIYFDTVLDSATGRFDVPEGA